MGRELRVNGTYWIFVVGVLQFVVGHRIFYVVVIFEIFKRYNFSRVVFKIISKGTFLQHFTDGNYTILKGSIFLEKKNGRVIFLTGVPSRKNIL